MPASSSPGNCRPSSPDSFLSSPSEQTGLAEALPFEKSVSEKPTSRVGNGDGRGDESTSPVGAASLRELDEVSRLIESLVASWHDSALIQHRRRWHRMTFQDGLVITPLEEESEEPNGCPRSVVACDVSLGGIAFVHDEPLPCRKVAVTFALNGGEVRSIVTRLRWCRFGRDGRYRSGGKFLRPTASPIDTDVDWSLLPGA